MNKLLFTSILAAIGSGASIAPAATLLEYDFDSTAPASGDWGVYYSPGDAGTAEVYTTFVDTGNIFGEGIENTYARYQDASGTYGRTLSFAFSPGANPLLTLSFDFQLYTRNAASSSSFGFYTGALNANTNAAVRVASGQFAPLGVVTAGDSDTWLLGTAYLLYNGTATSENYYNPVSQGWASLASNTHAAFFYLAETDTWVDAYQGAAGQAGEAITRIGFFESTSGTTSLRFDNLRVADELTVVPEPSTYALAGVAGLAGLIALRRRRS